MMKIIAVVGPERCATRFMSKLVSMSPTVAESKAYYHDLGDQELDGVWDLLKKKKYNQAQERFLQKIPIDKHALTRRCFPHAGVYDRLKDLHKLAILVERELVVIVLTRDQNIVATSQHRVNKSNSLEWNFDKVRNAYRVIFKDVDVCKIPYSILNYETLMILKSRYFNSVLLSLGIAPPTKSINSIIEDGNTKYVDLNCNAPTEFQRPDLYKKNVIHYEKKGKERGKN